jgi:adenosylhomocysteinase
LYEKRPALIKKLKGVCEETTSGVRRFRKMEADGILKTPVIAVNDLEIKTGFDNAYGTGESVIATVLKLTKESFAGKNILVMGYGPVGKGCALRARALGANTYVADLKYLSELKAKFDGFYILEKAGNIRQMDIVISATGVPKTISYGLLKKLKDGAILAVAGGVTDEIAISELIEKDRGSFDTSNPDISVLKFNKKTIFVLAAGEGVNYTSAEGNPIEIMDLSFSAQFLSLGILIKKHAELPSKVINLKDDLSEEIAKIYFS